MKKQFFNHKPVFLKKAVCFLKIRNGGVYIDATLGGGGHTNLILKNDPRGAVFGFDLDEDAVNFNQQRFKKEIKEKRLFLVHSNFKNLAKQMYLYGIKKIDGIIFDLGVSSPQFDKKERGFSYRKNSRLDMRMDKRQTLDAYHAINYWDFGSLQRVLKEYGNEKFAYRIVRNIIKERALQPITTTQQLVHIIKVSLPDYILRRKGHPAKKTFQAIRIAINDELNSLKSALEQSAKLLNNGGRIVVISFQSLEDRIVKNFFKKLVNKDRPPSKVPVKEKNIRKEFTIITKHPLKPGNREILNNHRSHSAKLRVLEKN